MDILACPVCKAAGPDLILYPIEVIDDENAKINPEKVKCRFYCAYTRGDPESVPIENCRECVRKRIRVGVIVCRRCGRWYPILDEIPVMLDDKFRDEKLYRKFAREYAGAIPKRIRELMRIPALDSLLEEEGQG